MSRFDPFARIDLSYRHINSTPLETTILIPKTLISTNKTPPTEKKHPLMVRWHGGGFVVGHRMYEPWFAQWLLDLSLHNEAIVVSPDYQLMPESDGRAILEDIACFWQWLRDDLPDYLHKNGLPEIDLDNVLCCGESSGGFISVYCALNLPFMLQTSDEDRRLCISAIISISAPLDATAPEYTVPRPRKFLGRSPPPPRQALAKIREYVNGTPQGKIRTGCEPTFAMWELLLCIVQQAYLPRLFGPVGGETGTSALESLKAMLGTGDKVMVPAWIVHGVDDTMCPVACSTEFVQRMREDQPEVPVHMSLCPGEHLFDVNVRREVEWVQDGVIFIRNFWPRATGTMMID